MTGWILYLCLSLSPVTAFPYIRLPNKPNVEDPEDLCTMAAVSKLLYSYKLPIGEKEVRSHARFRVKRDGPTVSGDYFRNVMDGALIQLSESKDAFGSLGKDVEIKDVLDQKEQMNGYVENLANNLKLLQKQCVQRLRSGDLNMKTEDDSSYLSPTELAHDRIELLESPLSDIQVSDNIDKRSSLALNPSGWRRRRSSVENEENRMRHFLRNIQQLLEKRQQQRLNFNPTGW